jgi:hypothetical protein
LCEAEAARLTTLLDQGFDSTPALLTVLENLAQMPGQPPSLRWPAFELKRDPSMRTLGADR